MKELWSKIWEAMLLAVNDKLSLLPPVYTAIAFDSGSGTANSQFVDMLGLKLQKAVILSVIGVNLYQFLSNNRLKGGTSSENQ